LNYGSQTFGQTSAAAYARPSTFAPFVLNAITINGTNATAAFFQPRYTDFVDGTSKTMVMSEMIKSRFVGTTTTSYLDTDVRGAMLVDSLYTSEAAVNWISNLYMTINTPNSSVPDANKCQTDDMSTETPCTNTNGVANNRHAAARSRHRGGVGVLFADGSVRLIADAIRLEVWRAIGTLNGSETAGLD
jgi:prepilin-type processing-associated H-X9-DG protein